VAQNSAKMLTTAPNIRFGAGDIMPPQVQQAWWKGMLTFIASPEQLDSVLSGIESVAQQSYSS
jgi:alpha-glucoside transport system substrate-binding protein